MVVQQNDIAVFYKRSEPNEDGEVEWEVESRIRRFPKHLQGDFPFNLVFSPNFEYRIRLDFENRRFFIQST